MTGRSRTITSVGAGLGGSLMAVYLGRAGYKVAVYERRTVYAVAGMLATAAFLIFAGFPALR